MVAVQAAQGLLWADASVTLGVADLFTPLRSPFQARSAAAALHAGGRRRPRNLQMSGVMKRACLLLGRETRLRPVVELVRHFASKASPGYIEPGFDFGRPMFGPHYGVTDAPIQSDGLPLYVDWHKVPGVVGKPFNQGELDICFICAPLTGMSCVNCLATYDTKRESVVLSLQHVLDCNTISVGSVLGGFSSDVLDFAITNGGILSRSVYPFTGKGAGTCKDREGDGVSIDSWMRIRPNCELSLRYALAFQPVIVDVHFGDMILADGVPVITNLYTDEGTISGPGYIRHANHVMVLYGYGEDKHRDPVWDGINSYGTKWGQGGKCRILRGTNYRGDSLGVLRHPAVPLKFSDFNGTIKARCESCPFCFKKKQPKRFTMK